MHPTPEQPAPAAPQDPLPPSPRGLLTPFASLANRNFRLLWLGQVGQASAM